MSVSAPPPPITVNGAFEAPTIVSDSSLSKVEGVMLFGVHESNADASIFSGVA